MTKRKTLNEFIKGQIDKYIEESPEDAQNLLIKNFNNQLNNLRGVIMSQQKMIEKLESNVEILMTESMDQKRIISGLQGVIEHQKTLLGTNMNEINELQTEFSKVKAIKETEQKILDKKQNVLQEYDGVFTEDCLDIDKMRIVNRHEIVRIGESKIQCDNRSSAKLNRNILDIGNKVWWKVKINGFGFSSDYYFIGVVSDKCTDFGVVACDGLCDAYGIHGSKYGSRHSLLGRGCNVFDESCNSTFRNGEVIYIEYNNGTLTFKRDETKELIYSLQLPSNKGGWYPAVSLKCGGDTCQIMKQYIIHCNHE